MIKLALSIPCIPVPPGGLGWARNRRNDRFFLFSPLDFMLNGSDWFHRFTRRLPPNTIVLRDADLNVIGYAQNDR